ncbi:MAG: hypothetical protein ABIO06_00335 [Pseudolysinimonas sp.]
MLRPPAPKPRAAVWAAGLGVDLSTLSDGATKAAAEPAATAVAVTETETSSAPVAVAVALAVEDRQSLESVLEELLVFDGSIGVALVDGQSGMVLGEAGSASDLGLSAAGASVILRARLETNEALGRDQDIADVLITLSSQVQIIHPLSENPNLFLYLIGDKAKSSLAMARYKAAEADDKIRL